MMAKIQSITFIDSMVQAIRDGRKTQTRRAIKPQPIRASIGSTPWSWQQSRHSSIIAESPELLAERLIRYCPYGKPGDRLWVKENLRPSRSGTVVYSVDGIPVMAGGESHTWKWKRNHLSGWFMPRWASRLTLEITRVWVERVQEITFSDCRAEGCDENYVEEVSPCIGIPGGCTGKHYGENWHFKRVWDSLNAKRGFGWDVNPWVWGLGFKRVVA